MSRPTIKTPAQLVHMRRAGLVVAKVHSALRAACRPGVTLLELDQVAHDVTVQQGAKPNFLGYGGFPASVCISVNDMIVHGIPDETPLTEGDLVSFDCGAVIRADGKDWHGDAAFSMIVGTPPASPEDTLRRELSAITEKSMWAGIAALEDARRISEVGAAVEDYVETAELEYGWTPGIIEGYTGHGIGNALHEDPPVYNYRTRGRSEKIKPGMVFCVEPMLVAGDIATRVLDDEWGVVTQDGKDAAHWEHTVAVTAEGISVLTAPDGGVAGLRPFGVIPVSVESH